MGRLSRRLWVVFVASSSSIWLSVTQRPLPHLPPPLSIPAAASGPFANVVGIPIASNTVVETLMTTSIPAKPSSGIPQEESVLNYMYHNAAGQQALLQSSYERLDQMNKLIRRQDDRIQKLMDRLESYESQSKASQEAAKKNAGAGAENTEAKKLLKLLSALPSARAVSMLQEMDDATVASLLSQMKEADAAKLLAGFPSKRAANITLRLAPSKRP